MNRAKPTASNGGPRLKALWVRDGHVCALAAITLIGLALRIMLLFQPMRYDESYTYTNYVSAPLGTAVSRYNCPNNHIFHTLLVRESVAIFGDHPWAIRLPALIFGASMIPAAYLMAAEFFGLDVALVTAALTASSSALVEYSTNARGYTIVCVCFMLIVVIARHLTLQSTPARWYLFSIISAIGFYAIPVMLFPFGIVVAWIALDWRAKGDHARDPQLPAWLLRSFALTGGIVFVLYFPVLTNTGWRSLVANRFVTPQPHFLRKLVEYSGLTWALATRDLSQPVVLALVAGLCISIFAPRPSRDDARRLIAAVVLWCSTVLLAMRAVPDERAWLFTLPLGLALATNGLRIFARSIPVRAVVITPLIAIGLGYRTISSHSILKSDQTGALIDGQAIATFLESRISNNYRVLAICPSDGILRYYLDTYHLPSTLVVIKVGREDRDGFFAVVNVSERQSLAGVLKAGGIAAADLKSTTLVAHFASADAYQVELAPGWIPDRMR